MLNLDGKATYKYTVTDTSPAAGFDPLTIDTLVDDRGTATTADDKLLVSGGVVQSGVTLRRSRGDQDNLLEAGGTAGRTPGRPLSRSAPGPPTNTNTATVTARDDENTSATASDTASVRFVDYGQIAANRDDLQPVRHRDRRGLRRLLRLPGRSDPVPGQGQQDQRHQPRRVLLLDRGCPSTITGSGPVFIDQSDNNANIGPFAPVPNDVKLWLVTGTTCTQVQLAASQITISNGDVTVDIARRRLRLVPTT